MVKIAIFCRKTGGTAVKTAAHFRANGMDVSLLVVEVGVRKKRSATERQFQAAHEQFRRYLLRRSSLKERMRLAARVAFDGLPSACRDLVRPNVLRRARAMGIPACVVQKHSSPETRDLLEKNEISYVLLASSAWLVKEPLLSMATTRIINAHCAKLPEHRSLDALPWSVLENDPVGLTAHFVDRGIDTGPVLLFQEVAPQPGDNLIRLRQRVDAAKPEVFLKAVRGLVAGTLEPAAQQPSDGVHHRPMTFDELVQAERALQRRLASAKPGNLGP
ncbi:MAG TPA: formyltransferase family protein [Thermoguttaceae bacterium]|nr:formyltransferase family protein [Thermoguttaceae bacterium]